MLISLLVRFLKMGKFSLKRYLKKNDGYVIFHKDMEGAFRIDLLTADKVDAYRKKHHFIIGPKEGKNGTPYPRYAATKEIMEKFKKVFEEK